MYTLPASHDDLIRDANRSSRTFVLTTFLAGQYFTTLLIGWYFMAVWLPVVYGFSQYVMTF